MGGQSNIAMPYHDVPDSILNQKITGSRRFVAQSWSLERVREAGKAYGGTINDIVMAMCSGALQKYLNSLGELPSRSLKAMAPVSFRSAKDIDSGNAVGLVVVDLGTNETDPANRIHVIKRSMDSAKQQLKGMSSREAVIYNGITHTPLILSLAAGMGDKLTAWSTVISNVPGSRKPLYWNGARLRGMYPVSMIADGIALNFTVASYHDNLDVGIVACRKSLPHVQRLIEYMDQSLDELEEAAGL